MVSRKIHFQFVLLNNSIHFRYEYYSGHLTSKKEGAHLEISAVEQNINLHLRGGHVVANHFKTELTIDDTRKKHGFQVSVFPFH